MNPEELRLKCIELAVELAKPCRSTKLYPTNIIATAKKFERWVIGKKN